MTQVELNHAGARATGETIDIVARMGFGIADPAIVCHDPEPSCRRPRIVHWDRLDASRPAYPPQRSRWQRKRR